MAIVVRPDVRKTLPVLQVEWGGCRRCSLGEFRDLSGGNMVYGEGDPGGLMFIGEGPGRDEANEGRPFVGPSGRVLRHTIARLGLRPVYISNAVLCRSCVQDYDTEGNPKFRKNFRTGIQEPVIKDQAPTKPQLEACYPRLVEEIYMVDPKIIVTLGKTATETLLGGAFSIIGESNKPQEISIPGAGVKAQVTAKKGEWIRRVKGVVTMPVEQNEVKYIVIPVLHPSYVLSKQVDARHGNPLSNFLDGMRKAAKAYARLMLEVYGDTVVINDVNEEDLKREVDDGR